MTDVTRCPHLSATRFLLAVFEVVHALAQLREARAPADLEALEHLGETLDQVQDVFDELGAPDAAAFAGLVHDLCTLVYAATAAFEDSSNTFA